MFEDSSSDEDNQPKNQSSNVPRRTAAIEDDDDDDDEDDDFESSNDKPDDDDSDDDDKDDKKPATSNQNDNNDSKGDNPMPEKKDNDPMDVDDKGKDTDKDNKIFPDITTITGTTPSSSTPALMEKEKTINENLFGDSDDDDDDDDAVFDDVVGSSAPAGENIKKSNIGKSSEEGATLSGDEDDGDVTNRPIGGDGGIADSSTRALGGRTTYRPPPKAAVLDSDRPKAGVSLHMTRLPNLVGIQTTAFVEEDFDEKEEEDQYNGYVHNMIRWRYKRNESGDLVRDDGNKLVRESNSKIVKWSDGSFTLHVGNEAFDIQTVDSSSNGFPGLNGFVYLSQKATFSDKIEEENGKEEEEKDKDEQEQKGGTVLECIGPVASRLVAKPSSLQSEAHKSLTVAVRQRTIKKARIAEYVTEEDPEKAKLDRIKTNTDADKQRQRKRAVGAYRTGGGRRNPGMNRSYLEASDDEQYDSINIRALKKGSANYDMDDMDDYGEDSDDDYDDTFASRGRKRQRKAAEEEESDEDEVEMVFEDDDEEEEEIKMHKKKKTQSSHAAVLDDEE